jgi:hypothetical protein
MPKEMTVKEKMIESLVNKGMWPDQAEAVFAEALPRLEPKGYKLTLDAPASDYGEPVYVVASLVLDEVALAYIDQHCPQAWFRPMFARKEEIANV